KTMRVVEGHQHTRLRVSHAFHSHLMDPMLDDFRAVAQQITFNPPRITIATHGDVTDPEYWVRHVRDTVRFADHVHAADVLVEMGPGSALAGLAAEAGATAHATRAEPKGLLTALAKLY